MLMILKLLCLATYALGLAAALDLLPAAASIMSTIALALLAAHALEVVVMFKHVRRYQGPLWMSIVLTLLFGLLHWKPLAAKAQANQEA